MSLQAPKSCQLDSPLQVGKLLGTCGLTVAATATRLRGTCQPAVPPACAVPMQAGPVIEAGGIFEFARSTGMIKAKA